MCMQSQLTYQQQQWTGPGNGSHPLHSSQEAGGVILSLILLLPCLLPYVLPKQLGICVQRSVPICVQWDTHALWLLSVQTAL